MKAARDRVESSLEASSRRLRVFDEHTTNLLNESCVAEGLDSLVQVIDGLQLSQLEEAAASEGDGRFSPFELMVQDFRMLQYGELTDEQMQRQHARKAVRALERERIRSCCPQTFPGHVPGCISHRPTCNVLL